MKTNQPKYVALFITSALLTACVSTDDRTNMTMQNISTQSINAPERIAFNDTEYTLVNRDEQDKDMGKLYTYQYTTDGQTLQNWQSIISIAHNTNEAKAEDVLQLMANSLENTTPKPLFDIKYNPDFKTALAQIIYPPQADYPVYESSAWVLDFSLNCPGYTSSQFALRLPADTPNENIVQNNNAMTQYLVENLPKIDCAR